MNWRVVSNPWCEMYATGEPYDYNWPAKAKGGVVKFDPDYRVWNGYFWLKGTKNGKSKDFDSIDAAVLWVEAGLSK